MPTPVPPLTPVPHFPALSERALGTYNSSAYAFGTHMADTFNGELAAVAENVKSNADEAAASAGAAAGAVNAAAGAADAAAVSAGAAAQSEATALTYAQAAGASAGVPTPTPNAYLQTTALGVPMWGPAPTDNTKLNKLGGVADNLGFTYLDLGTIAAGGTATINTATATTHRVQAGGALTLVFSNLISGAVSGEFELLCVNFGGKVITWPAGNWIKSDGSYAAAVGNSGVTWQTSGVDRVLVMIDNGAICYKVMR
jgi:hypothetical protein